MLLGCAFIFIQKRAKIPKSQSDFKNKLRRSSPVFLLELKLLKFLSLFQTFLKEGVINLILQSDAFHSKS